MTIKIAGASNPGVREYNDDHFLIGISTSQTQALDLRVGALTRGYVQDGILAAVADGIGSYEGGGLASRTVLEQLQKHFYKNKDGALETRLDAAVKQSTRMLKQVIKHEKCRKAGTTLAGIALYKPSEMVVFHIGDSRVLRMRDGQLMGLTIDHTPVGEPLAFGKMTLEEALQRRDAFHLTRSLGLMCDTRVETRTMDFRKGDRFLLMTDGVCSPGRGLDGPEIEKFLKSGREPKEIIPEMLKRAIENDGDNATLVLVYVDD